MLNFRTRRALLATAITAATIVIVSSAPGSAQDKNTQDNKRQAAIEKCFAQERGSGEVVPSGAGGENRAAVYKDCMRKMGYPP